MGTHRASHWTIGAHGDVEPCCSRTARPRIPSSMKLLGGGLRAQRASAKDRALAWAEDGTWACRYRLPGPRVLSCPDVIALGHKTLDCSILSDPVRVVRPSGPSGARAGCPWLEDEASWPGCGFKICCTHGLAKVYLYGAKGQMHLPLLMLCRGGRHSRSGPPDPASRAAYERYGAGS